MKLGESRDDGVEAVGASSKSTEAISGPIRAGIAPVTAEQRGLDTANLRRDPGCPPHSQAIPLSRAQAAC